jgi:hypothetical protein
MHVQFSLEQLDAMSKEDRDLVLSLYLRANDAPDLAEKVAQEVATAREPSFRELIAGGVLKKGQPIRSQRQGVPEAIVGEDEAKWRWASYQFPAQLRRAMGRTGKRGRPTAWTPPLFRVNDDGSLTPLDELLKDPAVIACMRRAAELRRMRRLISAVGKPFHHCEVCGRQEREVKGTPLPPRNLLELVCGHLKFVPMEGAAA